MGVFAFNSRQKRASSRVKISLVTPKTLRFCPGCQQRRLQMNAAPCALCGRENLVKAPKPREKMHISAKMLRALLRPLGWMAQVWTLLFCGFVVWSMALHNITEFMGGNTLGILFSGLIVAAIWTLRLATRGLVWLFAPTTRATKRPGARSFGFLPLCLAVLALLNAFDLPLRAAFWLSKPGLESLAFQALSPGFQFVEPQAGLYRVSSVTQGNGRKTSLRFQVTDDDFFNGGTRAGFARCPQGCAAASFPPLYAKSFPSRYLQLSRDWFWWEESGSDE